MNLKNCFLALAVLVAAMPFAAKAVTYDLTIAETTVNIIGVEQRALSINGGIPGPVLRFKEGEDLVINVTNKLDEDTSIHWHGLILPYDQDGVPGISYPGIKAKSTFTYRFPAQQSGTYWYHSHSGLQEQVGIYGAIVIEPKKRDPFRFDREYVVVLSDWHKDAPESILGNLKKQSDYYNYQQRTVPGFFEDVEKMGFDAALADRMDWGDMRMTPTDIADVSGYTFLVNGKNPKQNWTGLFKAGERVRLRFINAAAMTYFDVRIPGLKMTVVQADGNNVRPVPVDEFRIAVAETYDVIVRPTENKAFTVFAESMARTGFARATLAPEMGMKAAVPETRKPQVLSMADMNMSGMDMGGMDHSKMDMPQMDHSKMAMPKMDHSKMAMPKMDHSKMAMPKMDHSKMAMPAMTEKPDPFYAVGSGLMPRAADGGKMLSYADLKAFKPLYKPRKAGREIIIRLTGNMERYIWSINGKKYSDADPVRLKLGERVRFKFINETMMTHPMHLHGMWQILDNGSAKHNPAKHTLSIAPGTTVEADVEVDAPGQWAFHCHLMYHMASGMFRKVIVETETSSLQ
ncbi:MAG: copper resistance system multicopper oxidase [Proteobacteria bacterium]|nr:copper resistance system multicopper oxidase [Pseudomonadota bacterium]MDA1022444.1 copper resistance system multicopper oxidase [Pseudomonadota bacterium]